MSFSLQAFFPGMLLFFMLAHFSHHLLTALPVPMMPLIRREYSLDYSRSGLALSIFNVAYGISQLPAGWVASKIGARNTILIGIAGVALAGLLVGLSTNFILLLVFFALMGVMGGGYHPSAPSLISASTEPEHRGRALGFHLIGGSASYFLSPLIAAGISAAWGWRVAFIALAIPTALYGLFFYIRLKKLPRPREVQEEERSLQNIPGKAKIKLLAPFIAMAALTQASLQGVAAFLPLYMVDIHGVTEEAAPVFISLLYSAGIWAGPLGGYLSDCAGNVRMLLFICFTTGPVIFLLNLITGSIVAGAIIVLMGVELYFLQPTTEAWVVSNTSERHRASVLGIMYFSIMEGTGLVTLALGYLIESFGFYHSISIAAGAVLVAAALLTPFLLVSRNKV